MRVFMQTIYSDKINMIWTLESVPQNWRIAYYTRSNFRRHSKTAQKSQKAQKLWILTKVFFQGKKTFRDSVCICFLIEKMASTGDVDQWVEISRECKYLPENDLKVCIILKKLPKS